MKFTVSRAERRTRSNDADSVKKLMQFACAELTPERTKYVIDNNAAAQRMPLLSQRQPVCED